MARPYTILDAMNYSGKPTMNIGQCFVVTDYDQFASLGEDGTRPWNASLFIAYIQSLGLASTVPIVIDAEHVRAYGWYMVPSVPAGSGDNTTYEEVYGFSKDKRDFLRTVNAAIPNPVTIYGTFPADIVGTSLVVGGTDAEALANEYYQLYRSIQFETWRPAIASGLLAEMRFVVASLYQTLGYAAYMGQITARNLNRYRLLKKPICVFVSPEQEPAAAGAPVWRAWNDDAKAQFGAIDTALNRTDDRLVLYQGWGDRTYTTFRTTDTDSTPTGTGIGDQIDAWANARGAPTGGIH